MKILVINSGSSSIKFKLFDMNDNSVICKGLISQIGQDNSEAQITNVKTNQKIQKAINIPDHGVGIDIMNSLIFESKSLNSLDEIDAVGHRVVQGAELFKDAALVNDDVINKIASLIPIAPLHNGVNLAGIKECLRANPSTPNVAVFDTVFHQTMEKSAYLYALPLEFYEKYKIRKYGAHGTSHEFVLKESAKLLGKKVEEMNAITLHIGSGASIAAIKNGKVIDTSMGFTPLEGLMMGSRCGDIDPAVIVYLEQNAGLSPKEMDDVMNKKSGLLAICGTNDMRIINDRVQNGDEMAILADEMFVRRIKKYIGAYHALIGKLDAIVFTAGIGENDERVRANVCAGLEVFGMELDLAKNDIRSGEVRKISKEGSKVAIIVAPTDEELAIAEQTQRIVKQNKA